MPSCFRIIRFQTAAQALRSREVRSMRVAAHTTPTPADQRAALEDRLLVVAVQAAAIRAYLDETDLAGERGALIAELERAETLRLALEQQVRLLERRHKPWWRRLRQ